MPIRVEPVINKPHWYHAWFSDEEFVDFKRTSERNYSGLDNEDWFQIYVEALRHLPARPARVIDLGCGCGYGADLLARAGYAVLGIDASEQALAFARLRAPGAWFVPMDMGELSLWGLGQADAIVAIESLEHVVHLERALREVWNTLKPGGLLFLSTPDRALLGEQAGKNEFHPREYTQEEFTTALLAADFVHVGRHEIPWSDDLAKFTMVLTARRPTREELDTHVRPRCASCGEDLSLDHTCVGPIVIDGFEQYVFNVFREPNGSYIGACSDLDLTVRGERPSTSRENLRAAIQVELMAREREGRLHKSLPRCASCGEDLTPKLDHVCTAPIVIEGFERHPFRVFREPDGSYIGACETLDLTARGKNLESLHVAILVELSARSKAARRP